MKMTKHRKKENKKNVNKKKRQRLSFLLYLNGFLIIFQHLKNAP